METGAQEHKHNYSDAVFQFAATTEGQPLYFWVSFHKISSAAVKPIFSRPPPTPRLPALLLPFQGWAHVNIHTMSAGLNLSPFAKHFPKPCQSLGCGICLCKMAMAFAQKDIRLLFPGPTHSSSCGLSGEAPCARFRNVSEKSPRRPLRRQLSALTSILPRVARRRLSSPLSEQHVSRRNEVTVCHAAHTRSSQMGFGDGRSFIERAVPSHLMPSDGWVANYNLEGKKKNAAQ